MPDGLTSPHTNLASPILPYHDAAVTNLIARCVYYPQISLRFAGAAAWCSNLPVMRPGRSPPRPLPPPASPRCAPGTPPPAREPSLDLASETRCGRRHLARMRRSRRSFLPPCCTASSRQRRLGHDRIYAHHQSRIEASQHRRQVALNTHVPSCRAALRRNLHVWPGRSSAP